MKSEIDFVSEMAWNCRAINQSLNQCSPNTYEGSLRHLDIIKHVLSYLFDVLGYMNITLTNCVFVQTRQVCHSPDLSKMRWNIIVRLLLQDSLAYFSKLMSYRLEVWCQRHAAARRQYGCVISTYIFQNQNCPDILFAVLIHFHTNSDISLHCTCWWPCTVNH